MNIVLLGPPGSGKGTQARELSKLLGVALIDVGMLLRTEASSDDSIQKIMTSGGLLSDDIVNNFVKEKILPCIPNFILDGFPRTVLQAQFLHSLLQERNLEVGHVVRLVVSDSMIVDRLSKRLLCDSCGDIYTNKVKFCLKCGAALVERTDDSLDVINLRLVKYHEQSKCLAEFYRDKLFDVNGDDTVSNITKKIIYKVGV